MRRRVRRPSLRRYTARLEQLQCAAAGGARRRPRCVSASRASSWWSRARVCASARLARGVWVVTVRPASRRLCARKSAVCCMRSPSLFVCSPTAVAAVNSVETAPYRRRPRRRRAANGCVRAVSVAWPPATSQQADFFCQACSCSVRGVLHLCLVAGARRLVCRGVVWFVIWGVSARPPPNTPFPSSLYKPRTRAHASARERTRMEQDGAGWSRMDQNGLEWT